MQMTTSVFANLFERSREVNTNLISVETDYRNARWKTPSMLDALWLSRQRDSPSTKGFVVPILGKG